MFFLVKQWSVIQQHLFFLVNNGSVILQYLFSNIILKCYRLAKEKLSYEKETIQQEERIEKMKADGKDEYDNRKSTETIA
jgi:hypothetical protein